MHWAHVCMTESRPGDGTLCFCDDNYCNAASSPHHRLHHQQLARYTIISSLICHLFYMRISSVEYFSPS
ncbi:hypothetical protein LSH36_632g01057 [Paralvinella palmiformis]|uniref:Protein sleepless n=1 Tax=Paralvinella palmiformis TaxID=53620 RepID=A0AAD9MVY0_9ANNE|nr:hypothetical protein LSH36_632g01057 [Paralvinella palmiformis]